MTHDSLHSKLKELRLSGLLQTLDVRLQEAAGHQLTHAEFLELILQDELLVRNERQIERRVRAADFRELKPLDQFDFSFNPAIPRQKVFELATCRFLREARDVLLVGPPGTGKSYLAQAIGLAAIKQGFLVYYRSIFDVVRDFLHDEAFEGQEKTLARYLKPDLLIVDDMGIKSLPRKSGEILFEIIMRRHETKSTLMTSNRPLEDWGKLIGDVPAATAILDRFLHHAELIPMTGKSYRLRNRAASEDQATATEATVAADAMDGQPVPDAASAAESASETVRQDPASTSATKSKPAKAPTGLGAQEPAQAPTGSKAPRRRPAAPANQNPRHNPRLTLANGNDSDEDNGTHSPQFWPVLKRPSLAGFQALNDTWLNDHTSDVFVVATCNDISRLPPEFTRAERFDGVFFVDLPDRRQREAIWKIALARFGLKAKQTRPVDAEWTGAEIAACCRLSALLDISLIEAAQQIVPIAKSNREAIDRLRHWADGRCLSADAPGVFRARRTGRGQTVGPEPSTN